MSSSAGTKTSIQVEDGNFRLNTRFLEHHPVTSSLTNQKKVTHPAALTPNLHLNTLPRKTSGLLSTSCPVSLLGPCSKHLSAPNSDVLVCLASLRVRYTNLHSTTILASQPGAHACDRSTLAGGSPFPESPAAAKAHFFSGNSEGLSLTDTNHHSTRLFGAEKCPDLQFTFTFVLV